jgi:metal-responsive CopG/Arc/MetJ family transcriptional regulator
MIDELMSAKKEGKSTSLTFRVQNGILIRVDHFIEKDEYGSYPDFFRAAARWYLDYLESKEKQNHIEREHEIERPRE